MRNWKSRHHGAVVVMYVNTSAEVKAETDYCCTSSNAVEVVEHIYSEHGPDTEILFGPDMWLGSYVERVTGKRMHLWPGECHVRAGIRADDIERRRAEHPAAELLIHPECGGLNQVLERAGGGEPASRGIHVLSTGGMLQHVVQDPDKEYVVATETGMLDPLTRAAPRTTLTPANEVAVCKYMKMITLPKLRDSLRENKFEVQVRREIAERARTPIRRMVAIG